MTTTPTFSQRAKFYRACISPFTATFLATYAVLGFFTWVRDEFLPEPWKSFHIIDLLPAWSVETWLIIGVLWVALALVEGALRQHRLAEEANSRSKPLIDASGNPYRSSRRRGWARFVVPVALLITFVAAYLYWPPHNLQKTKSTSSAKNKSLKGEQLADVKPTETPTAIYMECNITPLPVTIPPRTAIHLIPLNKKRMQSVKWGFYDVRNDRNEERQWPDKAIMKKATKSFNPAIFIWRCEVSNHGTVNVLDVTMPIKIWFGNEKLEVIYTAVITPLDAGTTFSFYPVNDCSETVSAVWPDTVKLQVLGELERREVLLRRTFKSPIDQIMMFFGSTSRFIGGEPCG